MVTFVGGVERDSSTSKHCCNYLSWPVGARLRRLCAHDRDRSGCCCSPFNPLAFSGLTATVTQTFAGPPKWGYTVKGGGAPPAGPAVFDTVTIDFDVPCDPPKSGGTPKITPTTGPSQHYVLSYPFIHSIAAITVTCDAFPNRLSHLRYPGCHRFSRHVPGLGRNRRGTGALTPLSFGHDLPLG